MPMEYCLICRRVIISFVYAVFKFLQSNVCDEDFYTVYTLPFLKKLGIVVKVKLNNNDHYVNTFCFLLTIRLHGKI